VAVSKILIKLARLFYFTIDSLVSSCCLIV
jgi:hypothetical protein